MRTIEMSMSNTDKRVLVDEDDFLRYGHLTWRLPKGGYPEYRKHVRPNMFVFKLHRLVMGLCTGDGKIVDHINRNTLDCRKCNLRIVNASESAINQGLRTNNKSGYKGVFSYGIKWIAQINKDRKAFYLGIFSSKHEAARAYNQAAKELWGDFAALNEIAE